MLVLFSTKMLYSNKIIVEINNLLLGEKKTNFVGSIMMRLIVIPFVVLL